MRAIACVRTVLAVLSLTSAIVTQAATFAYASHADTQVLPTGQNAHAVLVDASNRHVFVSNLGSDAVMQMRFDAGTGQLAPNDTPSFSARPKAGPRHLVFHSNGRVVYLLNELDAGVDVLAFDAAKGSLSLVQTLSSLPPGFTG